MEISRDSYLKQLIERKDNGMIKVITGIRRCGKSFLLFTIFKRYLLENGVDSDHIIEIALDGIESEELRDPKACFKFIKEAIKDTGRYYLLLDEVQFMPRFEEVLNSLLRISNVDVYVTGSNSRFLSSDIVTEFRGRGDEIRIYPLSFAEFYSAYDGDYDDAWDDYMTYGGLPQIMSFSGDRQKTGYLKNIFSNVYLKDVIERNRIQSEDEISLLVDVLASAIGAPTNPSKIANTFASERQMTYTNKTISKHIDYLADAFLISKASRYDIKGRKYIGANLKYYFTDLGLRNARLNFRQQEPTHMMENIVYNELLIRGYNVDTGIVEIFKKQKDGRRIRKQLEVDFVVNQGSQRYYIQVAYDMTSEEKQTQELNSLRNIPDSFKKIVIVNGAKKPWRNDEGFVIMGMKYFLLNADSLAF
ncbi:MAG: ATP-binding protein [Lachnospiraceae bacterium]|nr:ATP-binding protein [Lachnospiraceae bacterium]